MITLNAAYTLSKALKKTASKADAGPPTPSNVEIPRLKFFRNPLKMGLTAGLTGYGLSSLLSDLFGGGSSRSSERMVML